MASQSPAKQYVPIARDVAGLSLLDADLSIPFDRLVVERVLNVDCQDGLASAIVAISVCLTV